MSEFFEICQTPLLDLHVMKRNPLVDARGQFERMFCHNELNDVLAGKSIVQINRSLTNMTGTVRGLHFQHPPNAETKIISCLKGEVFDVAIDLRLGSRSYLKWYAEVLSEQNRKTMVIPEGFAHGFQALTEGCEMLYLHTAFYDQTSESGLSPTDPKLAIEWPLPISSISKRDLEHPNINNEFLGVQLVK